MNTNKQVAFDILQKTVDKCNEEYWFNYSLCRGMTGKKQTASRHC